jgi:dTDP-4-amino-4,6-dideoxygalactose transaminase
MIHFNRNHININPIKYDQFIKKRNENSLPNYSQKCEELIAKKLSVKKSIVKLTNSCTSALEFVSQIADFGVNDEIIMPSFTFVSSANPFVLRGSTPVFVDVDKETMNLDPKKIESAINNKTKAILFVHYAGFGQNIEEVAAIAKKNNLLLIEDAAQAIGSFYNKRALGTFGDFACFSFHSTKNISCGEGGCVVVNNRKYFNKVNIVYDKGTNRDSFFKGEVRKYQWLSKGSSYPVSEYTSFFLYNELLQEKNINSKRRAIWNQYYKSLKKLKTDGFTFHNMIF